MKPNLLTLLTYTLFLGFLSCSEGTEESPIKPEIPEEKPDHPEEKPEDSSKPDQPGEGGQNTTFINSSYIRGDFYELGNVSVESMNACTDLIYLTATPYPNGDVTFDLPHNEADFGQEVTYVDKFKEREGVVHVNGKGAILCGEGLLDSPKYASGKGFTQFSVGTYLYLDEWTAGAALFEKANQGPYISLRLDKQTGNLRLILNSFNSEAVFENTGLTTGEWQHVTFTFNVANNQQQIKVYVDGHESVARFTKPFNESCLKNGRGMFYLGGTEKGGNQNLKGYFDETFVSGVDTHGNLGKHPIQFDSWNNGKVLAYWKYDDSNYPGWDSHSWQTRLEGMYHAIQGNEKVRLRLGVIGSVKSEAWKQMAGKPAARENFARQLKKIVDKHHFAGVDLDLEWANSAEEFANYSATIIKLREELGKKYILTASLHPVSYKISKEAIECLDFISLQCYGPQNTWLPYDKFVACGEEVVAYGIPKKKLVMGIPFYGTSGKNEVAYRNLFPFIQNTDQNTVVYKGDTYYFDNLYRLRQKVRYLCTEGYGGVMSWDLANDLHYTHERSLLRSVNETLETQ